ncbi:hypothetical protein ACIBIZ_14150 [Nonomuraea spiralis]|uniref:Uncharacterized protein n=1 Tax=Nonomuraea spiralis TaxID=46182 RepID=A0ABV5IW97_9ACTN|nr:MULTISPECIES: hypothetical protein [Nonomuraea]GGS83274.1 hypothetical protein GCM10010176_028510 [Nonomuraea spiralis]
MNLLDLLTDLVQLTAAAIALATAVRDDRRHDRDRPGTSQEEDG